MQNRSLKGFRRHVIGAILVALLLFVLGVRSDTPWEDIKAKLSIEIGDGEEDFADDADTVEKGRFVTYKLEITNNGTDTHSGLTALFEAPDYMKYVAGSTEYQSDITVSPTMLPDVGETSPLAVGYVMGDLLTGGTAVFTARFQVDAPDSVKDEPLYTLAWGNILGKYSVAPIVSNLIETRIFGEAKVSLNVVPEPDPPAGQSVSGGLGIDYRYRILNVGGLPAHVIRFTPQVPEHTTCYTGCDIQYPGDLTPGQELVVTMHVQVNIELDGVTEIVNTGYALESNETQPLNNIDPIIHPIGIGTGTGEGDFIVTITQEPNIILNSANGEPRADKGDLTETVYEVWFRGRKQPFTYPILSDFGSDYFSVADGQCYQYYPNKRGAYTYAYNSDGGYCDDILACPPRSQTIGLTVVTTLPNSAPKLLFTKHLGSYQYGQESPDFMVNNYLKDGGTIVLPRIFTESRAIENGTNGIVSTVVSTVVSEDKYQYVQYDSYECSYDCGGEEPCTVEVPLYQWEKVLQVPVTLTDQDSTDITVYTSTAWLKTEGGHIGTNAQFTNNSLTEANFVDLGNPVIKPNFLTPSDTYTPPGETNSDYMIFGKNGTGAMVSDQENADAWLQTGSEFPYLEEGEAYDRASNPRDYTADLLENQKYGEVKTDELPSVLTGIVNIGDGVVWHRTGDLTIGDAYGEVIFSGGQSRIYVDGDVYIKNNIRLETSAAQSYNDITSLRIDAKNINVDGMVSNLEAMLLARENFYSGESRIQLRILGDVIAKNAYWQREPLNELQPTEFNKPSEYIIEDMRKYVVPVPGDTTTPDDYNIWRQVNPATGETLDAY